MVSSNRFRKFLRYGLSCITILVPILPAGLSSGTFERPNYSENHSKGLPFLGRILDPEFCSSQIKKGGNYKDAKNFLLGKCQGAGISPEILGVYPNQYFLFRTSKFAHTGNDRSELASSNFYSMNDEIWVSFELMLPLNLPKTFKTFYILQAWQCSPLAPIAGIKIAEGTNNKLVFITRNDIMRVFNLASHEVELGVWLQYNLYLRPSGGDLGSFRLYKDNTHIMTSKKTFGANPSSCSGFPSKNDDMYRIKFGIYKAHENGLYSIRFRRFNISVVNRVVYGFHVN